MGVVVSRPMKVKPPSTPQPSAVREPPAKAPTRTPKTQELGRGWRPTNPAKSAGKVATAFEPSRGIGGPAASLAAARQAVTAHATQAVTQVIAEHAPGATVSAQHPLLEKFGEALGMGLGVVVTEALALVPSWNKPLLDAKGKPVAGVEGAARIGDHDLRKRHEEVVGPQVSALVNKLAPGALHDLLEGLGKGATAAPGTSYRLEAAVSDLLHK